MRQESETGHRAPDMRQTVLRAFHDRARDLNDRHAILTALAGVLYEHCGVPHTVYGEAAGGDAATLKTFHALHGVVQGDNAERFGFDDAFQAFVDHYSWHESRVIDDNSRIDRPADDPVRRAAELMGVRSGVNVPIVKDGRPVAMVALLDARARQWTRDEISLFEELADRVWEAMSRARAEAALQERERNQAFLIEWSDRIRGETSPGAIMEKTLERLGRHLGVTRATFSESDDTGRLFTIHGEWRDGVMSIAGTSFSLDDVGEGVEQAWIEGAIVRHDDTLHDPAIGPDYAQGYASTEILAFVSIPLIEDGRVRSALSVQHKAARHWTDSEIQLLRDVAERTWVSLERARAEAELLERERHQAFLIDWSDSIRGEVSAEAVIDRTLEWLGAHLGASRTTFAESDPSGRMFTVTGEWRNGVPSIKGNRFALENVGASVDREWTAGEIVHYGDLLADPRLDAATKERYRSFDIAAFVSIPLVQGGQMRSSLSVQHRAAREWDDAELQLLRDIAERTWVALERARVQAAMEERERHQSFLLSWNDEVRRETAPQRIMAVTLERLGRHLGVTRVTYSESDAEGQVFTVRNEWRDGVTSNLGKSVRLGSLGDKIDREWLGGDLVCYDDVAADPRVEPAALERYEATQIRAFISVPIIHGGAMRSILSVQDRNPRRWGSDELQLMRDIAERAWLTLERAHAEAALQERERSQSFLLKWNDRIRNESGARGVLAQTLAAVGEHLGVDRANFAEPTSDGKALRVLQEWTDEEIRFVDQRYTLDQLGPKLAAVHSSGAPVRVDDTWTSPLFDESNTAMFDALGIRAVLTLPMLRAGRIAAVLSVQCKAPRVWKDSEVDLLRDLADRALAVLQRAHSEERLAESEAQLSAFLENAPLVMFIKDAEGRYSRINPEFARAMGRPMEELTGAHPTEIFPPDIADQVLAIEEKARQGQVASAELNVGLGQDHYDSVLSIMFPIPGATGIAKTGGFAIDLTERKRAEAALARSREALFQTEKLSALGSLLAGVSHELNNPLSIVVAQAVMMERQSRGSELAERAQKIRKAADRCARIVQTFLAMARQKRPQREAVDLNAVALAAFDLAEYGLRTDGIAAKRELAGTLPHISADADQLHQIIINLIVNAQQALAEQGAPDRSLTLRTGIGDQPGTVILEVCDNGPGIPEEARRRVFEPFYTTKQQGQGTGVGLSFSQGLAEAHGGRLDLMPVVRGACFRLTLPIDADHQVPAPAPTPATVPELPLRRALVVDDEQEIAESLADFLSIEGFSCDVAVGGAEAKARLADRSYDLIVSDIRMPGIDGPELHAWIAAERPELLDRVAFATGDTLGAAVARFLEEVQRPVLEKPFMPEAVRTFLKQMDLT